jgi:uncharacterized protein YdhG (YjbR/CyaY superfamily)
MAKTKAAKKSSKTFSAEERAAMKARAQELKAEALKVDGEKILLEAVAKMPPKERAMAKKLHEIVTASGPGLTPKTWYGMPAYANSDGKVVCYVKPAFKFNQRYLQFGFEDAAKLDDGAMWPVVFALTELKPADEKKIAALVKKAAR